MARRARERARIVTDPKCAIPNCVCHVIAASEQRANIYEPPDVFKLNREREDREDQWVRGVAAGAAGERAASEQRDALATIDIEQRSVYGRDLLYPIGDLAGAIQELTKSKTIDRRALRNLLDLGLSLRCSHPGCSRAITRDTITSAGAICDHGA